METLYATYRVKDTENINWTVYLACHSIYFTVCGHVILYINVNQIQFKNVFFPPTSFEKSKDKFNLSSSKDT